MSRNSSEESLPNSQIIENSAKSFYLNASLNALCANYANDHVVVAGREVLKILSVDEKEIKEVLNLRAGSRLNLNASSNDVTWAPSYAKHFIATAATNGSIVIWSINRPIGQKQERIINEHSRAVNRLCFHPSESILLLSASQDGLMKLWDLRSKANAQFTFDGKSEAVRDIQFSPTSTFEFAAAFENGTFQIWDMRYTKIFERKYNAHNALILSIDYHPDGRYIATGGRDKMTKIWDTVSDSRKPFLSIQNVSSVSRICWQPSVVNSSPKIACSSLLSDNKIHVFNLERPCVPYYSFEDHSNVVTGLTWKDSQTLWSVSKDHYFKVHSFLEKEGSGMRLTDHMTSSCATINTWGDLMFCGKTSNDSMSDLNEKTLQRTYDKLTWLSGIGNLTSRGATINSGFNFAFPSNAEESFNLSGEKASYFRQELSSSEDLDRSSPVSSYFTLRSSRKQPTTGSLSQIQFNRKKEWKLQIFNPENVQSFGICSISSMPNFNYFAENYVLLEHKNGLSTADKIAAVEYVCHYNAEVALNINDQDTWKIWAFLKLHLTSNENTSFSLGNYDALLVKLINSLLNEGDVQLVVYLNSVLQGAGHFSELQQKEWLKQYIEILRRRRLWVTANCVTKFSLFSDIKMLNQESTSYQTSCHRCFKPLLAKQKVGYWYCENCRKNLSTCSLCDVPVKGVFIWCRVCGHGGHSKEILDWFNYNDECPTGCGHKCTI